MVTAYQYEYAKDRRVGRNAMLRQVDFPEDDFKIQSYSKQELAELYGVHINTLAKWINRHYEKFEGIGYKRTLKVLDPAMVKLFIDIFSTP